MVNKYKIFGLISVIIIILGPIFGVTLNKTTLYDKNVLISTKIETSIAVIIRMTESRLNINRTILYDFFI